MVLQAPVQLICPDIGRKAKTFDLESLNLFLVLDALLKAQLQLLCEVSVARCLVSSFTAGCEYLEPRAVRRVQWTEILNQLD